MEKAKEFIRKRRMAGCGVAVDSASKMEDLKPAVKNLLHTYLPGDITLDEAEDLAICISDMIWNPREYLPRGMAKPPSL